MSGLAPEAGNSAPRYVATDALTRTLRDHVLPVELQQHYKSSVIQLSVANRCTAIKDWLDTQSTPVTRVAVHWSTSESSDSAQPLSNHLHRRLSMWVVEKVTSESPDAGSGSRQTPQNGLSSDSNDARLRTPPPRTRSRQSRTTPETNPRPGAPQSGSEGSSIALLQLRFTFGAAMVELSNGILQQWKEVVQSSRVPNASAASGNSAESASSMTMKNLMLLPNGWFAVSLGPYTNSNVRDTVWHTVHDFMASLNAHLLCERGTGDSDQLGTLQGLETASHMPQCMQLHNLFLQQMLLPKSKLYNKDLLECKERFCTVAGAIAQSVATHRAQQLYDQVDLPENERIVDLFIPYDVKTGASIGCIPTSNKYTGDAENFSRRYNPTNALQHIYITRKAAVHRLRTGHNLLKHSLDASTRNVASNPHGGNLSTMQFLWQQRHKENTEGQSNLADEPLDMAFDDEELDILTENNPMGVWPVTLTRPLSKLKLGRSKGRPYSKPWYQNRWQYIPVVYSADPENRFTREACKACNQAELKDAMLTSTQQINYRDRIEELQEELRNFDEGRAVTRSMQAERQVLEADLDRYQALLTNPDEYDFSWAPIWPFRDHISTSMRSEGEAVQAHTTWTAVGSQVHEQLFCNAFFGFGREVSPDKIQKDYVDVTEAVIAQYDSTKAPYVKGLPEADLFVPEFVRKFDTEDQPERNRMRCHNFADSYTYPLKEVEPVYIPFSVTEYIAINFSGDALNTVLRDTQNITQIVAAAALAAQQAGAADVQVPEHANRYHWADGPALQNERRVKDSVLLDYTENVEEGLRVALNSMDAKRILFPRMGPVPLSNGTVKVTHVAPEYPVLWPFGLGSGDKQTDPSQKASGYETRVDSVCILELHAPGDESRVWASTMAIVEYKMRMELSSYSTQFGVDQFKECYDCVCRDVRAAEHYHSTVTSMRSQLQAESNAWMVYLNTGVLPSHCIVVNGTRRLPPQKEFAYDKDKDFNLDQNKGSPKPNCTQYDCKVATGERHNCVTASKHQKASSYVCGSTTPDAKHRVPCCIVAISQFDARKPYLVSMLSAMAQHPFRNHDKGFNCYFDRHVLVPKVESIDAYNQQIEQPKQNESSFLRALVALLPTCELSRALIAALMYSSYRYKDVPLQLSLDARVYQDRNDTVPLIPGIPTKEQFLWCRCLTHPMVDPDPLPDLNSRYPQFHIRVQAAQQFTPPMADVPVMMIAHDPHTAGGSPQLYNLSGLRSLMRADDAHLLSGYITSALYTDERDGCILARVVEKGAGTNSQRQVIVYAFVVEPFAGATSAKFNYMHDPSGVQASSASIGELLFRQGSIVPRHRSYPTTESEMHIRFRQEMNDWVYMMATALLRQFEMIQLARSRARGKEGACADLVKQVEAEQLQAQAEVLFEGVPSFTNRTINSSRTVLKKAACAAMASMDAEDFFALTLLAGHRQQLANMTPGDNTPAASREYVELVVALKRALCKLHAALVKKGAAPSNPRDHWHWNMLAHMQPGEQLDDLNDPAHSWDDDTISYGDMHPFHPNLRASARPDVDDLEMARPSDARANLLAAARRRTDAQRAQDTQQYFGELAKHKAISIVRMVNRLFNSRVLAAVQAIAGEKGVNPAPNYEGNLFDPHSFSHMSQRAYWHEAVVSFCSFRPNGASEPPYWLAETFKHCVSELMSAITLLPKHAAIVGAASDDLRAALPQNGYPYTHFASETGVDVLEQQRAAQRPLNKKIPAPGIVSNTAAASRFGHPQ